MTVVVRSDRKTVFVPSAPVGTPGPPGPAGSGSTIGVKDEGTLLSSTVQRLNFTGAGVTATGSGADATIDIPGANSGTTLVTGISTGASAASNASAIQAAIDALFTAGGGTLIFPPGVFSHSGVTFKNKIQYRGAGRDTASTKGTVLLYTGTGDGVQLNNPINSSTAANVSVEGITFKNQNRNAGKGCFADTGSTDLKFRHCTFAGSDRGLIFDQTELADVIECDFEGVASQTCLAWLVNGSARTAGASALFTNRIKFEGCQFNGATGTVLIADDGGTTHAFVENNYNGGINHIRAAGVNGLNISGGEWESATGPCVRFEATTLAGTGAGVCGPVSFSGAPVMVPTAGQPCITIVSAGLITLVSPLLGNSTSAKVTGCTNAAGIISLFAINGGGGATFDGFATAHFEIDNNAGVKTNISTTVQPGAQLVLAAPLGTGHEGTVDHVASSPFGITYVRAKGGTGGWQGSVRLQVSYNGGSLFDALKLDANTDGTTVAGVLAGTLQASSFKVGTNQVIGARQTGTAANASDLATAIALVNDLKAKLTTHGLIS